MSIHNSTYRTITYIAFGCTIISILVLMASITAYGPQIGYKQSECYITGNYSLAGTCQECEHRQCESYACPCYYLNVSLDTGMVHNMSCLVSCKDTAMDDYEINTLINCCYDSDFAIMLGSCNLVPFWIILGSVSGILLISIAGGITMGCLVR